MVWARSTTGGSDLAVERLTMTLGRWRGPLLDGAAVSDALRGRVDAGQERRLVVIEACVRARLDLGQHDQLAADHDYLNAEPVFVKDGKEFTPLAQRVETSVRSATRSSSSIAATFLRRSVPEPPISGRRVR
jgi:Bacterial transcriptional activator domain